MTPGAPFMCTPATTTGTAARGRGPSSARGIQERKQATDVLSSAATGFETDLCTHLN